MAGEGLKDALNSCAVLGPAREGAVEIDHVEELRSGLGKQQRLGRRVVAIDGCAVHIAFGQAHDLSGLEVDCGEYDQGFHSRKRLSKARP